MVTSKDFIHLMEALYRACKGVIPKRHHSFMYISYPLLFTASPRFSLTRAFDSSLGALGSKRMKVRRTRSALQDVDMETRVRTLVRHSKEGWLSPLPACIPSGRLGADKK